MSTTAEEMNFDETPGGYPISMIQNFTPGEKLGTDWNPKEGDDVGLEFSGEFIDIRNLVINGDHMSGEIRGFNKSQGIEFKGLKLGQSITFLKKHVWNVSLNA